MEDFSSRREEVKEKMIKDTEVALVGWLVG